MDAFGTHNILATDRFYPLVAAAWRLPRLLSGSQIPALSGRRALFGSVPNAYPTRLPGHDSRTRTISFSANSRPNPSALDSNSAILSTAYVLFSPLSYSN